MRCRSLRLGLLVPIAGALSSCMMQAPPTQTFPVFFNEFSSTIDATGTQIVANAAALAKQYPGYTVTVTGYADRAGSAQAELDLSKGRADAVANLLQQDGVAAARIKRDAVGTPANSQPGVERRRVEIDIGA